MNFLFHSLEEEGVITECLVKVLDDTDTIDFDFQTENVVSKVVFKVCHSMIGLNLIESSLFLV